MPTIGQGVFEIRIRDQRGAFRVITVVKQRDHVYVLHAFQKKSEKTLKRDLELAVERLRSIA